MIGVPTILMLLALVTVPLAWLLPRGWAFDAIAAWTLLVLACFAPVSTLWLLAMACAVPLVLRQAERIGQRNAAAAALSLVLVAGFSAAQFVSGLLLVGVGYFTLRHLHVIGDWWMGRLAAPGLRAHLRYQLFLPVMVIGPINRIQTFERQCTRRRWDLREFACGAERVLTGTFMASVLGVWLVPISARGLATALSGTNSFLRDWAASAMDWVSLYFVFAGMTSIALGISLMMGLTLEENFNRPWQATSLLDFWRRWHMTLSNWVHDYVFRPVAALTRNAFAGLFAAMLVIGLWHEYSAYRVLWSCWQVLGIVLTRVAAGRLRGVSHSTALHRFVRLIVMPLTVLAWLSLSSPVIDRVLELLP